jgi:hypothetical protein
VSDDLTRDEILDAGPDDGNWTDVLRRTKRARRRQEIYGAAFLVALAAIVVACSSVLGHPIVDFGKAQKAPENVVVNFAHESSNGPKILNHQTREIPGLFLFGKPYKLYVAPAESDGFCMSQGGSTPGTCYTRGSVLVPGRLDSYLIADKKIRILGAFGWSRGERLVVSYADGSKEDVPFVWVTAPIDAGFFVLGVSKAHRFHATRPTALVLYDARGNVLARRDRIGSPWALGHS